MTGFGGSANRKKNKSNKSQQLNFKKWFNQAIYFHQTGKLRNAELTYKKLVSAGIQDPAVFCNLGVICKNSGRTKEALKYYEEALNLQSDDSNIYNNIGNLYREIGNLDQALDFTLKSLEFDQESSTTYFNLGCIYRELGQNEQALLATIKSIELDDCNLEAHHNLQSLADDIQVNSHNKKQIEIAFEILLKRQDFSHRKLCPLFIQLYLEKIKGAAQQETIISDNNLDFRELASDWRFAKSLTLLIPPHQCIEEFLTRLRRELLFYTRKNKSLPEYLLPLVLALSIQCFLNEYVYYQSKEEKDYLVELISECNDSEDKFNRYLPILACYVAAYQIKPGTISNSSQSISIDSYRELFDIQFREVEEENAIKSRLGSYGTITNTVSLKVQEMYEHNPYPRYRFADYTYPHLARQIAELISNETTRSELLFTGELSISNTSAKVLIAGCGTGNQIVNATRYKNAEITAIDISKSSLAYAIRKSREYNISRIRFEHLDILDVVNLQNDFDVIECSGVLHHMENPAEGLAALNRQLKPGGYIKIGLYSALARQQVTLARKKIQALGIQSTPEGIRDFRRRIFNGEFEDFANISTLINDFYSLSECRDLCFHVQEHHFTTASLKEFLERENLIFCGFMLPCTIKTAYWRHFPEDRDATSWDNWGKFEEHHPLTFQSMYQFWAYKPL